MVSSVRDLLATQKSHSVGVITYYAQQRNYVQRRLREALGPEADKVQVGTVDAFQGIEKDVILLSMVRSNPRKQVGFLSSPNRLNVSLSRARRLLVLIGDVSTVTSNPTIRSVYEYCREVNGVIHQI